MIKLLSEENNGFNAVDIKLLKQDTLFVDYLQVDEFGNETKRENNFTIEAPFPVILSEEEILELNPPEPTQSELDA